MAVPMWVREPIAKSAIITTDSFSPLTIGNAIELVPAVSEATLIEEIAWAARTLTTSAGQFIIVLKDGTTRFVFSAHAMAAGVGSLPASDRMDVNITLPVGWSLLIVQDTGASIDFSAIGGIVR
jgi:hypothetical protein